MSLISCLSKWYYKVFEFIKFGMVGSIAFVILYVIYAFLLPICGHNAAYTIGYAVSFVVNYLMTVYFTFKVKSNVTRSVGFAFSHVINYLMQIGCLNIFLFFGMPGKWAPMPVLVICIPVNFLLVRYFIKKNNEKT